MLESHNYFVWNIFVTAGAQDKRNFLTSGRAKAWKYDNDLINLPSGEFTRIYRLTKKAVKFLCKELNGLV